MIFRESRSFFRHLISKFQILLILLFCILMSNDCFNIKADEVVNNLASPNIVFSTLEDIYKHNARSISFFKNIETYLSMREPNVYNKSFWSIAHIYNFANVQKFEYLFLHKIIVLITFEGDGFTRDYILFEKSDDAFWSLTGMVTQSDRYLNEYGKCDFHLTTDKNADNYWLVLESEVSHGTDISIFNQIWYNPDGSEALQYEANGYAMQFTQKDEDNGKWYSAGMYFKSGYNFDDSTNIYVNVSYDICFNYPYNSDIPIYRTFDNAFYCWHPESKEFVLNIEKSSLKSTQPAGYNLVTKKYAYHGMAPIKTQESWIKVLIGMKNYINVTNY